MGGRTPPGMNLPFTLEDLQAQLPAPALALGETLREQGAVENVDLLQQGRIVTALVRRGTRYRVYVRLLHADAGITIDGTCTCPTHRQCEHVSAALLELLARHADGPRQAGEQPPNDVLGGELSDWISQLSRMNADPDAVATSSTNRLVYLLRYEESPPAFGVEVLMGRRLKDGHFSGLKPYGHLSNTDLVEPPQFFSARDVEIIAELHALRRFQSVLDRPVPLFGERGGRALRLMLATGRTLWRENESPLMMGATLQGTADWVMDAGGTQHLHIVAAGRRLQPLPVEPLFYVDTGAGECGELQLPVSPAVAARLVCAPAVPPEQVRALREAMTSAGLYELPQPLELDSVMVEHEQPQPILHLSSSMVPDSHLYWRNDLPSMWHSAQLYFSYQGIVIAADDPLSRVIRSSGQRLLHISRQPRAEAAAAARLTELGFQPFRTERLPRLMAKPRGLTLQDDDEWLAFMTKGAPQLQAEGWQIQPEKNFWFDLIQPDDWLVDLVADSRQDWFDVKLGIRVGETTIDLAEVLIELLPQLPELKDRAWIAREAAAGYVIYSRTPDGKVLPLPLARLEPILLAFAELFETGSRQEPLRVSEHDAVRLAELAKSGQVSLLNAHKLIERGERIQGFRGLSDIAPPAGLQATLRGYQREGLAWLQFLREYELGGILADDMGLGKTVQALAHILAEKEAGRLDCPALVVAPTSLMFNWRREAAQFAPQLKVLVLHGPQRKENFDAIAEHDLVLTTYPLLPRDQDALLSHTYHLAILDEAQNIKNPTAQATQVALRLDARHRVCLTGTPLENHLGELWSLFHFLMPGFLGDLTRFRRVYRTPIEKDQNRVVEAGLAQRVAPFILRRTKGQVAAELPPKTEIIRQCELSGAQRDLYETLRVAMLARVQEEVAAKGMARSQIIILDALLKLRQVCCDPRLVNLASARKVQDSAKRELVAELLPELVEEGRRVLVFSQFAEMLALLEEDLKARKIPYSKLTGQTRDREGAVNRFQKGEVPVFLITLKAGGVGLNLTAADTVIHYDPWWNPAAEEQATDRAHRIGQDQPVFVYKLITRGTVEEKILEMQERKRALAAAVLDGTTGEHYRFTGEDLSDLFQPL